jgi:hypothetical protein
MIPPKPGDYGSDNCTGAIQPIIPDSPLCGLIRNLDMMQ